jgi:type IV pilus assembly protein PilM
MPIQPGVWGIDLGQCALKALRLEEIDGQLTATAFDYVEHPKILSQPDADPDELTREALQKFLSRNTLKGDLVAISVPGQSGLARFVKLPPVEEKKITDIVRFEAKQQIPFNLEEVVWDYQKIGSGAVTDGFAMETEIGLFAMKRDMVNRYLQHFKDVGVEVNVVQMAPLALCNFIAFDLLHRDEGAEPDDRKRCIVALDIGADASNLVVTDGGRIIWQRPIPLGGNHFTRALTKDLKLTFAKAEHLKRNATKSPDLKKILASLKPVLNDFVGEVQRSLGYFTNTHRDAQIEYVIGLGNAFRLPGLQRFLSEKLQIEVKKLGKLERLEGDSVVTAPIYTENVLSFGVAYGLALQGLKRARLLTNLLPNEIQIERLVRAKKPWAVAAAGALLLGLGGYALSFAMEKRAFGNSTVQASIEEAKKVKGEVDAMENQFNAAKTRAKDQEDAVKAIIAGQAEQPNWLALNKFISDCIPRPSGPLDEDGNPIDYNKLPPDKWPLAPLAVQAYWVNPPARDKHPNPNDAVTGERAYRLYKERQNEQTKSPSKGLDNAGDDLGQGIDDLIQVNLEAVDCRYTDNLAAFWNNVKNYLKEQSQGDLALLLKDNVRPKELWDKPPSEEDKENNRGWVVEVRGYTYHHMKRSFIIDTFVENLARRGKVVVPKEGDKPAETAPMGGAEEDKDAANDPLKAVQGRISHVVLLDVKTKPAGEGGNFELIGNSFVDGLMRGGMGVGGAMAMGGEPGGGPGGMPASMKRMMGGGGGGGGTDDAPATPGSPARDGWVPLGGQVSGGFAMGRGMGGEPGMGGPAGASGKGMMRMMERMRGGPGGPGGAALAPGGNPEMRGGAAAPGPGGKVGLGGRFEPGELTNPNPQAEKGKHYRTEFVVLFIWRENLPSDPLRNLTDETAVQADDTSGFGGAGAPGAPGR